jgi:hypothetical protein
VYGLVIMFGARPVYVAFSADRYEIVMAADLRERSDAMYQAVVAKNEEHQRPRFYVPLESHVEQIRRRARPLARLEAGKPESKPLIEAALADVATPAQRLAWVPVRHFRGFWTAIIDTQSGEPVAYIDLDPY